jgi:hypothetical protein
MRYTNTKNGIQERINYLLGCTDPDPSNNNSTALTMWSAQNSMVTNIRRVVRGIIGNSPYGKIMSGLQISQVNQTKTISLSPGIGFTVAGNIINIDSQVNYTKDLSSLPTGQSIPIYLMYEDLVAPIGGSTITYHSSNIMGTSITPINILSDDACSNTTDISVIDTHVKTTTQDLLSNDGLFLGWVIINNDNPTTMSITPSPNLTSLSYTYIESFGINESSNHDYIYCYDGPTMGTYVPIMGTGNKLINLQVLRIDPSWPPYAVVEANLRPNPLTTDIQIIGLTKDGGGTTVLADGFKLADTSYVYHVDIFNTNNLKIDDSIFGLTIKTNTANLIYSNTPYDWFPKTTGHIYGKAVITMQIQNS